MAKTIWKYELDLRTKELRIPDGGIVRHAGIQDDIPCIWVEVDPTNTRKARLFHIFGTGHDIPSSCSYIGTFQQPPFVWHLYEITR